MKKIIAFDLDLTLCKGDSPYKKSIPNQKRIDMVNQLYDDGYHIIIFTGRGMGTFGNAAKAKSVYESFTKKQLADWGIKYHELVMGKPHYDILIDDKVLNIKDVKKKGDITKLL
jgi:histidinol phosphatase-like enzyme